MPRSFFQHRYGFNTQAPNTSLVVKAAEEVCHLLGNASGVFFVLRPLVMMNRQLTDDL